MREVVTQKPNETHAAFCHRVEIRKVTLKIKHNAVVTVQAVGETRGIKPKGYLYVKVLIVHLKEEKSYTDKNNLNK